MKLMFKPMLRALYRPHGSGHLLMARNEKKNTINLEKLNSCQEGINIKSTPHYDQELQGRQFPTNYLNRRSQTFVTL